MILQSKAVLEWKCPSGLALPYKLCRKHSDMPAIPGALLSIPCNSKGLGLHNSSPVEYRGHNRMGL